jgi:imidazolonepropionase-like amidohydrolase
MTTTASMTTAPLPPRGLALRGRVWPGGADPVLPDGVVLVDGRGTMGAIGPAHRLPLPVDLPVLGGAGAWVGPGLVDAHVHLAFGGPAEALAGGVVAVRDLGAPLERALGWRTSREPPMSWPLVAVAGPLLTAPGGYPSRGWGSDGFAAFVDGPATARATVASLADQGVDLVKLALEPADGQPVPAAATALAVVEAAHRRGLAVSAHALTVAMVERAIDAGVDELCHTPVEPLPAALAERIAAAGLPVVSTLQTFVDSGVGRTALANARQLVAVGARVVYGTDLGNAGTRTGAEPRELRRLADAGLGPVGALQAATDRAAALPGVRGRRGGRLVEGEAAAVVVLPDDPIQAPDAWRTPMAVIADGRITRIPVAAA